MNKTFVIRKMAYHYNDEHLFVHTLGGIENTFTSEEEAKSEFLRLERSALEEIDLGDTAQLSGCSKDFLKEATNFKSYYKRKFNQDIVKINEHGTIHCERGTTIPKGLSDDDILQIRRTLDLKFYELSSYDGEPKFYGIWLKEESKFKEYCGAPYFYDNYAEALKAIRSELTYHFHNKKIPGSLESLTKNPSFLKSLISNSNNLEYDTSNQTLKVKYLNQDEATALNELLNSKPHEIKEISYSNVKDIEHWIYEEM